MGTTMPMMATCCECYRALPVNAQMQTDQGSLPLLVVLTEVDSVEAALEAVKCQKCLNKTGSPDRGLYEVLKRLGLKDEDETSAPREATVVIQATESRPAKTGGAVVITSRPREVTIVDPLMGTSIQVARLELPARQRGRGQRRDDWRPAPSEPRVPRALRKTEHREPATKTKAEPFTGSIGDCATNAAVLGVAMKVAKERDEARRLERAQKDEARRLERAKAFDKLMFWLRLTLAKIRKQAPFREVWNLVDTWERKLSEAVSIDPLSRGKKWLMEERGTSRAELESLRLRFYEKPWTWRRCAKDRLDTLDAFEGGRRPESWDEKGGKKPALYEFEVVGQAEIKVSNTPLPGGDEDPRPRIVYPQDGQYGSDYTVEHSRCKTPIVRPFSWEVNRFGWDVISFASWLSDHPDLQVGGLNLCDLVCSFIEPTLMEEEDEPTSVTNPAVVEPLAAISPELPATT